MPARYRLVSPAERVRVVLTALVLVPFLTVVLAVSPFVVLRPYVGDGVAGVVSALGGLVALVGTGRSSVRAWREQPPVVIDRDGVLVRVERYRARRMRVPWPEIETVAVSPVSEVPGRVRVVVGLRPGSRAQAGEFAARIDDLDRLAARHDPDHRADGVRSVARTLERWQEQWARVPQPVGLHTEVRRGAGDHGRLAAAVARLRPGLPVLRLPPLTHAELDTPHDAAATAYRSASAVLEPPAGE